MISTTVVTKLSNAELAYLFDVGKLWIGGITDPMPGVTQQIIAALRQSNDKVLVPREPTAEMIDATWKLAAPDSADYQAAPAFVAAMTKAYLAMLSAAEAEKGRPLEPCPLCGSTEPHSHTSGPMRMSKSRGTS